MISATRCGTRMPAVNLCHLVLLYCPNGAQWMTNDDEGQRLLEAPHGIVPELCDAPWMRVRPHAATTCTIRGLAELCRLVVLVEQTEEQPRAAVRHPQDDHLLEIAIRTRILCHRVLPVNRRGHPHLLLLYRCNIFDDGVFQVSALLEDARVLSVQHVRLQQHTWHVRHEAVMLRPRTKRYPIESFGGCFLQEVFKSSEVKGVKEPRVRTEIGSLVAQAVQRQPLDRSVHVGFVTCQKWL
mmetsp:Transcript_51723/g.138013  ORF Transcript_51723/g.138013 Transcript_51723/m.138013 type:complete len:240 (-) Transcript_51723:624-1343(-)